MNSLQLKVLTRLDKRTYLLNLLHLNLNLNFDCFTSEGLNLNSFTHQNCLSYPNSSRSGDMWRHIWCLLLHLETSLNTMFEFQWFFNFIVILFSFHITLFTFSAYVHHIVFIMILLFVFNCFVVKFENKNILIFVVLKSVFQSKSREMCNYMS